MEPRPAFVSVGHGTASQARLTELLTGADVRQVVDVRRFPASRAHPRVQRDALEAWLPAAGIGYRWEERLGGRRRLPPDSPDIWWRVAAFRAYAAHMRTAEFTAAMAELAAAEPSEGAGRTALLCSESLWWRCHRRLICDYLDQILVLPVLHLMPNGQLAAHQASPGGRTLASGLLIYDAPPPR